MNTYPYLIAAKGRMQSPLIHGWQSRMFGTPLEISNEKISAGIVKMSCAFALNVVILASLDKFLLQA